MPLVSSLVAPVAGIVRQIEDNDCSADGRVKSEDSAYIFGSVEESFLLEIRVECCWTPFSF